MHDLRALREQAGDLRAAMRRRGQEEILAPTIDRAVELDREVRVYGLGALPPAGRLRFCEIDEHTFVEDLAGCEAAICAAGNQLLGEAIYLGKPVFALPEPLHHEQLINSHFLRQMEAGDFATIDQVTLDRLRQFLARTAEYRAALERYRGTWNGAPRAVEAIHRRLEELGVSRSKSESVMQMQSWAA